MVGGNIVFQNSGALAYDGADIQTTIVDLNLKMPKLEPSRYGSNLEAGMSVFGNDGTLFGRIVSVIYNSDGDFSSLLFSDNIHPIFNLRSSIYQISSWEVITIDFDGVTVQEGSEVTVATIRLGILRTLGLVATWHDKIEKKRAQRAACVYNPIGWEDSRDRYDDEPPNSMVPVPRKPNPNLPSSMRILGDDAIE